MAHRMAYLQQQPYIQAIIAAGSGASHITPAALYASLESGTPSVGFAPLLATARTIAPDVMTQILAAEQALAGVSERIRSAQGDAVTKIPLREVDHEFPEVHASVQTTFGDSRELITLLDALDPNWNSASNESQPPPGHR